MRTPLLLAGISLALSGCASTAPQTAWGKPGVSRVDYGTEVGMCTGFAAAQESGGNGANGAGGISGSNNSATANSPGASGAAASNSAAASGNARASPEPLPPGGNYSGMVSADFAQRAATQQRSQEMATQRARAVAFKSCLTERGYREFMLTAEQRAHLASLKKGGNEYHEYLYQLGSDAGVIAQGSAPGK